jgi:hypothetical protein
MHFPQVLDGKDVTPWLGACIYFHVMHMDSHMKPIQIMGYEPNISCVDVFLI